MKPSTAQARAPIWRSRPRTTAVCALLAVAGIVVLADGALVGWPLYRLFAGAVGAGLLLPLGLLLLLGTRGARLVQRAGLSLATLALGLAAVEVWARWAPGGAAVGPPESRPDPVLAHAMVPGRGGFDAWGFRNPAVPARADVVVLGDSQTYGTNIRAVDSYPSALGRAAGVTVYNLGLGGYGPLQYVALTERALELEPRVLVVGFYFGNDLADAHRVAGLPHWRELRDPELPYAPLDALPSEVRAQHASPNYALAATDWLMNHSRVVWSISFATKERLRNTRSVARLLWKDPAGPSWDDGAIHTHFMPGKRLRHIAPRRRVVRDGLRITRVAFERIAAAARARDVHVALLAIHTKEHYYERWMRSRGAPVDAALAELAEAERWADGEVRAAAEAAGLQWVDPAPEILRALDADRPLWPAYSDGHLDEAGCALVADVLARELASQLAR